LSLEFLTHGVTQIPPWQDLNTAALTQFKTALLDVFKGININKKINKDQTEKRVTNKILNILGWDQHILPRVNFSHKGCADVPIHLLLVDNDHLIAAKAESEDHRRYRHAIAILETKRWMQPLDRSDDQDDHNHFAKPAAPSSEMLWYLSRADAISNQAIKWGILTNGAVWRLYWQDAFSRAEDFFEVNLATALALPGSKPDLDIINTDMRLGSLYCFSVDRLSCFRTGIQHTEDCILMLVTKHNCTRKL
jgi:hypothetical protein